LIQLIQSQNEYGRIVGLDYAIRKRRVAVLKQVDWAVFAGHNCHQTVITRHVSQNNNALMNLPGFPLRQFQLPTKESQMLSILERTIILKGTKLFENVPGEDIYYIAQVMEEERLGKGALLFQKGDKGDYLYIIVTGEILIHVEDREFTRHRKGEYFGEMALLDDAPRSTSATALEETLLLKVNQDNFLNIMMDRREVRKSIMRMLNERLRRLTDQYINRP